MSIRINSLKIKNFRSINSIELNDLSDVNIFIGKNNAGKSNILRAIKCFCDAVKLETAYSTEIFTLDDFNSNDGILLEGDITITYYDGKSTSIVAYVGSIKRTNEHVYTYCLPIEKEYIYKFDQIQIRDEYVEALVSFIQKCNTIERITKGISEIESDIASLSKHVNIISLSNPIEDMKSKLLLSETSISYLKGKKFTSIDIINESISMLTKFKLDRMAFKEKKIRELFELRERIESLFRECYGTRGGYKKFNLYNENLTIPQLYREKYIAYIPEKKAEIVGEDAYRLFKFKNRKEYQGRWNIIKGLVRKITGINLDVYLNAHDIPTLDIDKNWIDLNGTGIREILRIILDIEMNDTNIVLIEEPEIHLHFELAQKLSQYLLGKNYMQSFLTTHSTAFIENAYNQSVFLVKKDIVNQERVSTIVEKLPANNIIEAAKEVGINVTALLIKKVLIFVEGKTDRFILEYFFNKFYPYKSNFIGFIDMKGEANYEYYATCQSMSLFKNSGVKTYFILDSDNKNESQIKQMQESHPEESELYLWNSKCIETLFIDSKILLKFIQSKADKNDIDENGIREKMETVYEEIKLIAIKKLIHEKHLKPVYPERSKKTTKDSFNTIDDIKEWFAGEREKMKACIEKTVDIDESVKEFEKNWNDNKRYMVPGDIFLDLLCKKYGSFSYSKDENNIEHLVKRLSKEEWPKDIVNLCDDIVNSNNNDEDE